MFGHGPPDVVLTTGSFGHMDLLVIPLPGGYTTAFWRAASRNDSALSLGIRSRVSKST